MTTTPKDDVKPTKAEYRAALYNAHRALLHARKYLQPVEPNALALVLDALDETAGVLDYGRDEA